MSFTPRTRLVNPRLGTYFGIFASALVSLVVVVLIMEQLGFAPAVLRWSMFVIPLAFFAVFGTLSYTNEPMEYFASGRRVPGVYCGLGTSITALGGTGLVGMAGLFFVIGADALCILSGGIAGFVVMAVLLAPFLRKFGTFTLPSYLGRRFNSRPLRLTSAACLAVPMVLILVAELRVAIVAASWLTGQAAATVAVVMVLFLALATVLGGMRGVTWTNVVMALTVLFSILTTVIIIAVQLGYLPVPQLSSGPVLRSIFQVERVQAFASSVSGFLEFALPANGLQAAAKPFSAPFISIGSGAYLVISLTVMMGVASAPWLLPRISTAPGVYESRKSLGWATFFFGVTALTLATSAIFMRHYVVQIVAEPISELPKWVTDLSSQGLMEVSTRSTLISISNIRIDRDALLYVLPTAADLSFVFSYFAAAGIIAAALATAAAIAVTLANQLSEDIVNGLSWEPSSTVSRLGTSRVLLVVLLVISMATAVGTSLDPVLMLLWALSISAATVFPVLVASIWWKRINPYGAMAGVLTGFGVSTVIILISNLGMVDFDSVLAGLIAIPAAATATIAVSKATPAPSKHLLELVRDIRIPGGEILYDREMRLLRMKRRQTV